MHCQARQGPSWSSGKNRTHQESWALRSLPDTPMRFLFLATCSTKVTARGVAFGAPRHLGPTAEPARGRMAACGRPIRRKARTQPRPFARPKRTIGSENWLHYYCGTMLVQFKILRATVFGLPHTPAFLPRNRQPHHLCSIPSAMPHQATPSPVSLVVMSQADSVANLKRQDRSAWRSVAIVAICTLAMVVNVSSTFSIIEGFGSPITFLEREFLCCIHHPAHCGCRLAHRRKQTAMGSLSLHPQLRTCPSSTH